MTNKRYRSFFVLVAAIWLVACNKIETVEKSTPIPNHQWQYNFVPGFDFTISDTSSSYNLYVVLRHTDAYRYNNIWLNIGSQSPGDSMRYQRIDIQLGNDVKGWEGIGMDDIWELRKPITNTPFKFRKPGSYKFSITQVMRENPLPHIMNIGIRIEKVHQSGLADLNTSDN